MDRDWSVEVRVELKRLISDTPATRPGNPDGISCFYKRIDRQICRRSPRCNSRVRRHFYGGSRRADQFLLKCIIIGRYGGQGEGEDTHSAKQVNTTHTPRHNEAEERPASKSCQRHHNADIYTGPMPNTAEQSTLKKVRLRQIACQGSAQRSWVC